MMSSGYSSARRRSDVANKTGAGQESNHRTRITFIIRWSALGRDAVILALFLTTWFVTKEITVDLDKTHETIILFQDSTNSTDPEPRFAPSEAALFSSTAHILSDFQPSPLQSFFNLPLIRRPIKPDYGNLEMSSAYFSFHRVIAPNDEDVAARHRDYVLQLAEQIEVSSKFTFFEDLDFPRECIPPAYKSRSYPSCNAFHEIQLERAQVDMDVEYLANGFYRDSWLIQKSRTSSNKDDAEKVVLKHLRLQREQDASSIAKIHTEAVVMEGTSESPLTTNIYGYCSTSLLVESANMIVDDIVPFASSIQEEQGRISQDKLDALSISDVYSFNNYTALEKLDIAIQMAESLAEMHGFKGGVMINKDVYPDQWLITDDNRVILNDMNYAVFQEWNPVKEEYCKPYSHYLGSTFRAPEEYGGTYVDESIDLWTFGHLIFTLLTGLLPYYELTSGILIRNVTMTGQPPYLDPRYRNQTFIERRMTEIMDRCHNPEPEQRANIFQVVQHLRETKQMYAGMNEEVMLETKRK